MTGEISFDLVMEENMSFVEGSFRLDRGAWQVFVFSRYQVARASVIVSKWESGVSGVVVRFPQSEKLNKPVVEQVLSDWLGVNEWHEVRGPDSMELR